MSFKSFIMQSIHNHMKHYNHKKYWKMRDHVINPHSKLHMLVKIFYLFRIKRMDGFNNASMGTNIGSGALFAEPPHFPHGLNGIVISPYAKIGKKCVIYQQVTIAQGNADGKGSNYKSATIGDNCFIGAGAKIMGNVKIGDNVKIGANAVVTKDVPSNCTAVGIPAKIILDKKVNA